LRAFEGRYVSSKSHLQGTETEMRELLGEKEEKSVSFHRRGVMDLPSCQIILFDLSCTPNTYLIACTRLVSNEIKLHINLLTTFDYSRKDRLFF